MPKNDEFVPTALRSDYKVTEDDIVFADSFQLIEELFERTAGSSEKVELRVSTCRNIFLAINAIFVDFKHLLGFGAKPSLTRQVIEHAKNEDWKLARKVLNNITMLLSQIKLKQDIWNSNEEIDEIINTAINSMEPLKADKIKFLLWPRVYPILEYDKKFIEISSDSHGEIYLKILDKLKDMSDKLFLLTQVLQKIIDWGDAAASSGDRRTLFAEEKEKEILSKWGLIDSCLLNEFSSFFTPIPLADAVISEYHCYNLRESRAIGNSVASYDFNRVNDQSLILDLLQYISEQFDGCYNEFGESGTFHFKPNIARRPMPFPFHISLLNSDIDEVNLGLPVSDDIVLESLNYGSERPPIEIKVAFPKIGIPSSWINSRDYRYSSKPNKEHIRKLAKTSILRASDNGANALIFPEFFIPYDYFEEILELSSSKEIVLISGLEGSFETRGLANKAVVAIPNQQKVFQYKHRPSNFEPKNLYTDKKQYLFKNTSIGCFSVLICSDFMEMDILDLLRRSATSLDMLIVCAYNPRPDLFYHFAKSDCIRLYTNVLVVDGCRVESCTIGNETARVGSCCCVPNSSSDNIESLDLELDIDGERAILNILNLNLGLLQKAISTGKPDSHSAFPPACRRLETS